MALELDSLLSRMKESINIIPGNVAVRKGPFAVFNENGQKPPLFWCFNNWVEPVLLANRLGVDQPLVSMRSFHGFIKGKGDKRANTVDLAINYVDFMLDLFDEIPRLIGGNCQGAPVAEAIAHNLLGRTGKKALLMTLEHRPFYSYPGSILMMFGSMSEKYNPFLRNEDPIAAWNAMHRIPAWGIVNGNHGKYFVEPAVLDLTAFIRYASNTYLEFGNISPGEMRSCDMLEAL